MSLADFIKKVQSQESKDIDNIKELQNILDQNKTKKEEVYLISFSAAK